MILNFSPPVRSWILIAESRVQSQITLHVICGKVILKQVFFSEILWFSSADSFTVISPPSSIAAREVCDSLGPISRYKLLGL
jgi:hypothetical protein